MRLLTLISLLLLGVMAPLQAAERQAAPDFTLEPVADGLGVPWGMVFLDAEPCSSPSARGAWDAS